MYRSRKQRRRCTNRCTKSFRPYPISPTVADYCRRIRLIPLSLSRQRSRVRVSSSPPFFPRELNEFHCSQRGCKRVHFCTLFAPLFVNWRRFTCALLRDIAALSLEGCSSCPTRIQGRARLLAPRASLVRSPACRHPKLNVTRNVAAAPASL